MKKITLLFLLLFLGYILFAQIEQVQSYNVDQQRIENGLPVNWFLAESKGYTFTMEKHSTYADKKQLKISSMLDGNGYSGVMMLNIPENLEGKEIIFEGKIKTENIVDDGFAGLFLQLKPKVDIENMEAIKLNGTHDWQTFGVRLKLKPKETHSIAIATYLIGKGTAWFADLTLKIDGKDYTQALKYPSVNKADTLYNFNSQLKEIVLTPVNIEKLAHVAQIWGLLKYFHPAVTAGKWDMDTELFKFLPTLLASSDQHTSERVLAAWIGHFGSFLSKKPPQAETKSEIATEADDQWIENLPYSDKLRDTLKSLCHVMPVVPNRYISYLKGVGNPVFDEYNYRTVPLSDVGFRLLGLFRYWNAIHYFNPNQKLMAQPWDRVLSDFIPVFVSATTKASLDAAYLQLFSKINDTHAFATLSDFYYRGVFGSRGVAFKTCFIQNQLVVTQLGDDQFKAGQELQIGDIIQEISGKSISSISDSLGQYVAASNESARKRDLPRWMLRTEDSLMLLKVSRDDKEFAIYVPTRKVNIIKNLTEEAKPAIRKMEGGIVVVDIGTFRDSDTKRLKDSLQNQKGLILDYRNYPSASVHDELSDMVFPLQQEFVLFSTNFGLRPGRFRYRSSDKVGAQNPNAFKGKIVMLVNETTQSASEFQVMAFRTIPGSLVIGSQTAGADGNVSSVPLPLGYSTFFSGLGVYYPDKTETQGVGIVPDRIVYPSIYGIREKRDELLQVGIDAILNP